MPSRNINLSPEEQKEILTFLPPSSKLRKKIERAGKTIKVSSGKAKGRNLQYWVCEQISRITGIPYAQGDDDCLIHSREIGLHGRDVVLRGEAYERFPFSIECKNVETLVLPDTIAQVEANTKEGEMWIIVHKRKAIKDPIVIMDWKDFERIWTRK
jgi:hypothetical protein